jgi:hypothetical protein
MIRNTLFLLLLVLSSLAGINSPTVAQSNNIPSWFHGAGCNLKYSYTKTPKFDTSECISAKVGHKEGDAHDNDNFIRITENSVNGVEWGCKVKTVRTAKQAEMIFAGECSDEGENFEGVITIILRPGNFTIVDLATNGRHTIDIYHIIDGLQ